MLSCTRKCLGPSNSDNPGCDRYQRVQSQCGPCRDPLTIESTSNTWCQILTYKDVDLEKLCALGDEIPILYPWSPTYNTKRLDYNKSIQEFPSAIVMAEKTGDIKKAMSFARAHNIPISVRGGGHSWEGYSLTEGFVIDLSRMTKVKIIPEQEVAVIDAGCLIGPTLIKLQEQGFVIPTGTCPNVGIAGLCLGGGVGFYDRKWGLTCDSLIGVKAVLYNGDVITADEKENSDLFWACRGAGGGNFCIVTKFVFKLQRLRSVYLFTYYYPWDGRNARKAVALFQRWTRGITRDMGVELLLKGKSGGFIINGQWLGSRAALCQELVALDVLGQPSKKYIEERSVLDAARAHADNNTRPPFQKVKSSFVFTPINKEGIRELVSWADRMPVQADSAISLSAMGGAISDVPVADSAFLARKALLWIEYAAFWKEQCDAKASYEWISAAWMAVRPYVSPYCYVNFPDRQLRHWRWAFWGKHYNPLVDIKRKYDPTNFFHMPQSIGLEYIDDRSAAHDHEDDAIPYKGGNTLILSDESGCADTTETKV